MTYYLLLITHSHYTLPITHYTLHMTYYISFLDQHTLNRELHDGINKVSKIL